MKPTRYAELARQAVGRMQNLGQDPIDAVCWAIEQAIDEHLGSVDLPSLPMRCKGMRRVALWLAHNGRGTPSTIAHALHTDVRVVSRVLGRLRKAGIAHSNAGRWSLVTKATAAEPTSPMATTKASA